MIDVLSPNSGSVPRGAIAFSKKDESDGRIQTRKRSPFPPAPHLVGPPHPAAAAWPPHHHLGPALATMAHPFRGTPQQHRHVAASSMATAPSLPKPHCRHPPAPPPAAVARRHPVRQRHPTSVPPPPPMVERTTDIHTPHPHDVLCGRGGSANRHAGNLNFRDIVSWNRAMYVTLTKRQKMQVARNIVDAIRAQDPPRSFLAEEPNHHPLERHRKA